MLPPLSPVEIILKSIALYLWIGAHIYSSIFEFPPLATHTHGLYLWVGANPHVL